MLRVEVKIRNSINVYYIFFSYEFLGIFLRFMEVEFFTFLTVFLLGSFRRFEGYLDLFIEFRSCS